MPASLWHLREVLWVLIVVPLFGSMRELHQLAALLLKRGTITRGQPWRWIIIGLLTGTFIGLNVLAAMVTGLWNPFWIGVVPRPETVRKMWEVWLYALIAVDLVGRLQGDRPT